MSNILGNTVNSVKENALSVLQTVGRAALHTLAPDNIEFYMCSLELLDSSGNTKGFMTLSVMPNNMLESRSQIVTITKTNTGISSVFNSTFVPRDISIQGTFGRKLRLVLGNKEVENVSVIPFFGGNLGINTFGESSLIKTGYGLIKMLKSMIDASWKLDDNKRPCVLVFNNYAFNTSYIVEATLDSYSQSTENNMLWYYSLDMKAVAPAEAVKRSVISNKNAKFLTNVAANSISKNLTRVLNDITRSLNF